MSDLGYREELERIAPGTCISCKVKQGHADGCRLDRFPPMRLVVDPPLSTNTDGWGHIGNRIISHSIITAWRINSFLEVATDEPSNLWVLTERAQLYLTGKVKESELRLPPHLAAPKPPGEYVPDEILDVPIEGLLFTRGGTCTLCGMKMEAFGQVSHAKSHINKGHPVFIEEINKKKVCKVTPGAKIEAPIERPPAEQGDFVGPELFSTTGICRLCPEGSNSVHLFGRISHAKSHMKRGDPVELRTIQKKTVPVLSGEIMPEPPKREAEPYRPEMANGQYQKPVAPVIEEDLTPEQANVRNEGIAAILKIQEMAGLAGDRDEAAANWDKMGPVSRMQTMRTAKSLEG